MMSELSNCLERERFLNAVVWATQASASLPFPRFANKRCLILQILPDSRTDFAHISFIFVYTKHSWERPFQALVRM